MNQACHTDAGFVASMGWRMQVCGGAGLQQADLKRQEAGELAIMRIDCTSGSRGGSRVLECTAWLDLLCSALLWQAIIRQKAGTDTGDNWVGGRKTVAKMENGGTEEDSLGASMEKVNAMKRRQKEERKVELEWEVPSLFVLWLCTQLNEISLAGKKCHTREFRSHENRLARRLPGPVCTFVKWMRLRGPWSTWNPDRI